MMGVAPAPMGALSAENEFEDISMTSEETADLLGFREETIWEHIQSSTKGQRKASHTTSTRLQRLSIPFAC